MYTTIRKLDTKHKGVSWSQTSHILFRTVEIGEPKESLILKLFLLKSTTIRTVAAVLRIKQKKDKNVYH